MPRKILILGGQQFMGRAVVEALLKAGDDVTLLSRGKTKDPFGDKVKRITADRDNRPQMRAALANYGPCEAILDFSAAASPVHKVADVVNTMNGKVGHFVFVSTSAVYQSPDWDPRKPQEEEATFDMVPPEKRRTAYGWDKAAAEELLKAAHTAGGFPSTRVRIPIVNGPHDNTFRLWRYHAWMKTGHPIYVTRGGNKGYSTVYSEDVITAILKILETGKPTFGQAYQFNQAERPTIAEVAEAMALSGAYPPVKGGGPRVRVLSDAQVKAMDEKDRKMLTSWSHLDGMDQTMSIDKARRELGWEPTPMVEWYPKTVEWYQTGESDRPLKGAPFMDEELMARVDKLYSGGAPSKL